MPGTTVETTKLDNVDWSRGGKEGTGYQVGFSTNGVGGSIKLSYDELKILRLLLERPVAGFVPSAPDNPGLHALRSFVASMEDYMARRGGR